MRNLLLIALCLGALFTAGCQTWRRGAGEYRSSRGGYTLNLPPDWFFVDGDNILATRDGVLLQTIVVRRHLLSAPLPGSGKKLDAAASAFELGEAIVNERKADRSISRLEVMENMPDTLGGESGVRVVFDYRTQDNLHQRQMVTGAIHGDAVYTFIYTAAVRHYFDADLAAAMRIRDSFRFLATP